MSIEPSAVTGLVLSGGRARRMHGADKGLQPFDGLPLAAHALRRLAPQVAAVMISANRNLPQYQEFCGMVFEDDAADSPCSTAALRQPHPAALPAPMQTAAPAGPLAGLLAGLAHCRTPWLAAVPCDAPFFPLDLVARLAQSAERAQARAAYARTAVRSHPVFCLLHAGLREPLRDFLRGGGRKVEDWLASQQAVAVPFEHEADFANINTLEELQSLATHGRPGPAA
jgi:molybdopterin-guanine dinucleotide biosynthesis protein A